MYRKDTGQSYRYRKRKWVQRAVENAQAYAGLISPKSFKNLKMKITFVGFTLTTDESSSSFTTDDDKHPRQSVVFTKAKKQETNLGNNQAHIIYQAHIIDADYPYT